MFRFPFLKRGFMSYGVVFITASSEKEGLEIGELLIKESLAACVNIIKGVSSIFFWEGEICNEQEVLLIAKTKKEVFEKLVERVKEVHSYDVPEIIFTPIIAGLNDYMKFIDGAVKNKQNK